MLKEREKQMKKSEKSNWVVVVCCQLHKGRWWCLEQFKFSRYTPTTEKWQRKQHRREETNKIKEKMKKVSQFLPWRKAEQSSKKSRRQLFSFAFFMRNLWNEKCFCCLLSKEQIISRRIPVKSKDNFKVEWTAKNSASRLRKSFGENC